MTKMFFVLNFFVNVCSAYVLLCKPFGFINSSLTWKHDFSLYTEDNISCKKKKSLCTFFLKCFVIILKVTGVYCVNPGRRE